MASKGMYQLMLTIIRWSWVALALDVSFQCSTVVARTTNKQINDNRRHPLPRFLYFFSSCCMMTWAFIALLVALERPSSSISLYLLGLLVVVALAIVNVNLFKYYRLQYHNKSISFFDCFWWRMIDGCLNCTATWRVTSFDKEFMVSGDARRCAHDLRHQNSRQIVETNSNPYCLYISRNKSSANFIFFL